MYDGDISILLRQQNNKITDSQLTDIRKITWVDEFNHEREAYNITIHEDGKTHSLKSHWGGSWEFEYKK